jgi:hypothetical protein
MCQDLQNVKQGQAHLMQGQSHTNTALEALATGQQDIREKTATKADIQDLGARLDRKLKSLDRRTENLEEHAGIPNPNIHARYIQASMRRIAFPPFR